MADYRKSEIVSGLFILVAIAIFILFAFKVGGFDPSAVFKSDPLRCSAYFSEIKTLEIGAKVSVGGKPVGKIVGIHFDQAPLTQKDAINLDEALIGTEGPKPTKGMRRHVIRVEFTITDDDVRLDVESASVALAQDGFLGLHYLMLDPGFWTEDADVPLAMSLAGSDTVPNLRVRGSGGLDALMAKVGPVMDRVSSILAKVERGVDRIITDANVDAITNMMKDLRTAIQSAKTVMANAETMTDGEHPKGLHKLILEPASDLIGSAEGKLDELTRHLIDVTLKGGVDPLIAQAQDTLAVAKSALDKVPPMLDESNPKLQGILDNLEEVTGNLETRLDTLQGDVAKILGNLDGMLAENRPGVAETVRRLQRTMFQFEMAIRKVRSNPAYLLFGDQEKILEAQEVDEAGNRLSGRSKAYGQRDETDDR